jgi:hypothetical protein
MNCQNDYADGWSHFFAKYFFLTNYNNSNNNTGSHSKRNCHLSAWYHLSLSLFLSLSLSLLLRFFLSHSLFSIGATTAVVQKLWQGITKHLGLKVKNGFVFLIKHTVHLNLGKGMLCKLRESVFCRLHKLWWVTPSNVVLWVCCCSLISLRPDPNNYHLALALPFF